MFAVTVALAMGAVNYADLSADGAMASAGYPCNASDPGAYPTAIYDEYGNPVGTRWMCPFSVDTGGSLGSRAQVAIDGSGRTLIAANDSGSDELVIARFTLGGLIDTSWGQAGVARIPHSTIPGSTSWHEQLDVVAAGDGSVYVWTGDVAYRIAPNGTAVWETAVARCDAAGLPTLSLSPDDSILWTGGFDDGGCTNGYVGQIATASGNAGAEGWMDPYAFTIIGLDTTSAWVFATNVAAVVSVGNQIEDPPGSRTVHDIKVDATITYPTLLDYDQFRPFPAALYQGGQVLVAGPVEAVSQPTQVSVMLLSSSGMSTRFGSDGAVVIDTTRRVVGVGSNTSGTIIVALSDGSISQLRAFLPDGSPDSSFYFDGILDVIHPIDEMVINDDVLVMGWVAGSTLNTDMLNVSPPSPPNSFSDDDGSVFEVDIEWLAASGITKGCNPPTNDMFCPTRTVTRGQMAAFLHRALPDLPEVRPAIDFTDDDASIFEADIEWLYSRGVTQGTSATTFAPDRPVTRGQMAAFLVRALKYSDNGGGDLFIDDDMSQFEGDIDRLGTAGVTRGCNPPTNDRFCPDGFVTRGQMAAFLHRALGG